MTLLNVGLCVAHVIFYFILGFRGLSYDTFIMTQQLSLMQFSQQNTILTDYGRVSVASTADSGDAPASLKFPVSVIWKPGSKAGVIAGQWERRADGSIIAVYNSRLEFIQCLNFGLMAMGSSLEELKTKLTQKG